jgi:hypothetical protein
MKDPGGYIMGLYGIGGPPQKKADEKPERFVTSDEEALHAAAIRSACAALNEAVKAAAKDGLHVNYETTMEGGYDMWSPVQDGSVTAFLLRPTIMRKL